MAAIRPVVMGEPSLSHCPQHQVSAPDTTLVPFPVHPLPPFAAPSTSSGIPEQLMHKNRLQEYAQRSAISLPLYCTANEGSQHAPQFRSTVTVDGETYTSPNTFSHRKAAEQDVAKLALENILQKIKDEGCPLIHQPRNGLEGTTAWGMSASLSKAHFELWVIGRATLFDQGSAFKCPGSI